jgi:hypothetical protein
MLTYLYLFATFACCMSQEAPKWPNVFQEKFTERLSYPVLGSGNTSGTIFYDWTNERYVLQRLNGAWDRYCGTVFKFTDTRCNHIVSDGMRYLYFPDEKYCCMCCTAADGCGVLRPDWALDAVFVKNYTDEKGRAVDIYNKKGLQDNFVHFLKDSGIMVRIEQVPNDDQVFIPESFSQYVDASVFSVPGICTPEKKCPLLSTCSLVSSELPVA